MSSLPRLWVSGRGDAATGVGVYQSEIYPRLASYWALVEGPSRRQSVATALRARQPRRLVMLLRELGRELVPPRSRFEAALCIKPPYPIRRLAVQQVVVVLDLRWRRTRSPAARVYRWLNLRLALESCDVAVCISDLVRQELLRTFPQATDRAAVVHLGPGRPLSLAAITAERDVDLLLVSGAPHKRVAAVLERLLEASPSWVNSVAVVNPDATEAVLCERLRATGRKLVIMNRPSNAELEALLRRARWMAAFGTEEGFGLVPFEALRAGCLIMLADTPLHRELFDSVAGVVFAPSSMPIPLFMNEPATQRGVSVEELYSWDATASATSALLALNGESMGPN